MRKSVKHTWAFLALLVGLSLLGSSLVKPSVQGGPQQANKKPELPTLDYDTEIQATKATATLKSQKTRARFNSNSGFMSDRRRVAEMPQGVVPLPTNDHWFAGMPALPVAQSDVIVSGKVVDAQAHLSQDGTGVYSEFTVEVGDVFKNTGDAITPGSIISATRKGGAVRFASGKVQEYRISELGVPTKEHNYALFLKREEDGGDFTILTGYELSNNLVTPLDGDMLNLPFAYYKGAIESQFLQDLRTEVQKGGAK